MEVTKEDLRLLDFNRLMDAFPQDVALVREHGRWVIYRDRAGSSVPLHEQHDRQTYEDFIHEFMVQEMKKPYHGDFGFLDIVIEITMAMARFKKYRNRLNK